MSFFISSTLMPAASTPTSCSTELFQLLATPKTRSAIFFSSFRTGRVQGRVPMRCAAEL
uniref:Uncharacterized protein n=1 Tax=Anguilla anguilla TaxID=7936 RepID=A0A0E9PL64_ANGAN